MPHLHLPLQSGSDSVLRRMARRCKTEEFSAIVQQLRAKIPHFNITTDIIVGFPGETEQEWQDSFNFIKQTGFGHIHIFTYSRREGTKAANLPEQIPEDTKKQRSRQLHELANTMKLGFFKDNLGLEFPVLWEGYSIAQDDGRQQVFGYTPNYLRVSSIIEAGVSVENKTLKVKLSELGEDYIIANMSYN